MLHDVLRELRQVGEVDFLTAHQRFALAQAVGHRPGGERDDEHEHAQESGRGVVGRRGRTGKTGEHLLHEHGKRRHGGDQQGVAPIGQHGECQDRQHQQDPQAARDSAAGVQDQSEGHDIHAGVDERHDAQARPPEPPRDDQQHRGGEIGNAGGDEQLRSLRHQAPGRTRERLHRQQHERHQHAIQAQEPDHAPGEIARSDGWGGGAGRRSGQDGWRA